MGWTTTHRSKGTSNIDWFTAEFGLDAPDAKGQILDAATVRGVCYAAFKPDRNTDEVVALVILTQWAPNDYYNFGYKDQDEAMGPVDVDCPQRIFDLLTPLADDHSNPTVDGNWAAQWRQSVFERLAAKKARVKVTSGDVVRFTGDTDYAHRLNALGTLRFVSHNTFTTGWQKYRISGWRDLPYEVVTKAEQLTNSAQLSRLSS